MYNDPGDDYQPQHPLIQFDSSGPRRGRRQRREQRAEEEEANLANRMINDELWGDLLVLLRRGQLDVNAYSTNNGVDEDGSMNPLQIACYHDCSLNLFDEILSRTGNRNAKTGNGNTALMLAVNSNYDVFVRRLSQYGDVNPNLRNKNGRTALWIAVNNGDTNMVRELLRGFLHRITPSLRTRDWDRSWSPFDIARMDYNHGITKLLNKAANGQWEEL